MRLLRHLLAIVSLPFVVTVVVPTLIVLSGDKVRIGWNLPSSLSWLPSLLGCLLAGLGVLLL